MLARALALAALLLACAAKEQRVDVFVTSGRPQPPPSEVAVEVGAPVVVRAEGLGPPRIVVHAPDGAVVPTTDTGTEHRFTPASRGKYRIELAEAAGVVLVDVIAR